MAGVELGLASEGPTRPFPLYTLEEIPSENDFNDILNATVKTFPYLYRFNGSTELINPTDGMPVYHKRINSNTYMVFNLSGIGISHYSLSKSDLFDRIGHLDPEHETMIMRIQSFLKNPNSQLYIFGQGNIHSKNREAFDVVLEKVLGYKDTFQGEVIDLRPETEFYDQTQTVLISPYSEKVYYYNYPTR